MKANYPVCCPVERGYYKNTLWVVFIFVVEFRTNLCNLGGFYSFEAQYWNSSLAPWFETSKCAKYLNTVFKHSQFVNVMYNANFYLTFNCFYWLFSFIDMKMVNRVKFILKFWNRSLFPLKTIFYKKEKPVSTIQ